MNIPNETIGHIKEVLIRQAGDTRVCPCCNETFIPEDRTAEEAMQMYRAIEQLEGQGELDFGEEDLDYE